MKNVKLILVFLLSGALLTKAGAQNLQSTTNITTREEKTKKHHFYLKAGLGYAFVQSGQAGYGLSGSYQYNSSFDFKPASYSAGTNGSVGAGYMFNEHFGAELDANIGIANKKYSFTYTYTPSSNTETTTINSHAKTPVFLMPAIVVQTGGKTINVYARLGIVLPVKNKIIFETEYTSQSGIEDITYEFSTKFRLGVSGAIGLSYKISRRFQLWGEANLISFSPYLKEGVITKYILNGTDNLAMLPPDQKKADYGFSGISSSNASTQPTRSMPYSNIGIIAGVSFQL